LFLVDEDTCATNFMIRDNRMQLLVAADKEPITPFIGRVRDLYLKDSVSSILVVGGAGDYFDVVYCLFGLPPC
jgi:predicted ABC-class ATPase